MVTFFFFIRKHIFGKNHKCTNNYISSHKDHVQIDEEQKKQNMAFNQNNFLNDMLTHFD